MFSSSVMKSDNVCWLAAARISSSIEIVPAQVLAIKAGPARYTLEYIETSKMI